MRRLGALFRRSDFRAAMFGHLLVSGQMHVALTIMPLYTLEVGGSAFDAALHTAIFTGGGFLFRFYFGPLADRRGRRWPMLIGALAYATANLLFLLCTSPWSLALARAYQAIGLAAYLSTSQAVFIDLVDDAQQPAAISLHRSITALSLLIFPAAGEQIIEAFGFQGLFAGMGAIGLISLYPLVRLPYKDPSQSRLRTPSSFLGTIGGFMDVLNRPAVPLSVLIMAALSLISVATMTFLPLLLAGVAASGFGAYFAAMGITAIVSAVFNQRMQRYGAVRMACAGLAASGFSALLLTMPSLPLLIAAGVFQGFSYNLGLAASKYWLSALVPQRLLATAFAVSESAIDAALAFGTAGLGAVAERYGGQVVFYCLATLSLVVMALSVKGRQRAAPSEGNLSR